MTIRGEGSKPPVRLLDGSETISPGMISLLAQLTSMGADCCPNRDARERLHAATAALFDARSYLERAGLQ